MWRSPPEHLDDPANARDIGNFLGLDLERLLAVGGIIEYSSSPLLGTGPEISNADGSIERMAPPSNHASSLAIIGESIA